jgi:N-acetylmuramoyl-L-alanine amidase
MIGSRPARGSIGRSAWFALLLVFTLSPPVAGQEPASIRVVGPGSDVRTLEGSRTRGFLAIPVSEMEVLGWSVERADDEWRLVHPVGSRIRLVPGTPLFHWDDRLRQLVDVPYLEAGELWIPAQLVLDFLPYQLPEEYGYQVGPEGPELRVGVSDGARSDASWLGGSAVRPSLSRLVVVDAGHGGQDLGAMGAGGGREKDVTLAIARVLARELGRHPEIDVRLTRDSDQFVPLWRRGEWATEIKGERPAVFVSIHANSIPDRTWKGFETYFLSEARTDHERRVAAIENAPADLGDGTPPHPDSDLGSILNELRNLDTQHWSALLAELVQDRLDTVHPGPNRGVKQGPFAVITNALMPAVLVEVGFMSNREEERLLGSEEFQEKVGVALFEAVLRFFERYPPGNGAPVRATLSSGTPP